MAKKFTKFNFGNPKNPDAENIYYSLGGGIPLDLGVNIPIMEGLYFNLDLSYWIGSEVTVTDLNFIIDLPNSKTDKYQMVTSQSSQFRVNPGLLFRSESGLYAKTNLIVPVSGKTVVKSEETEETTNLQGDVINSTFKNTEYESTGKFSLGVSAGLGYNVTLAENMKLGFELQALALNIQSSEMNMTAYEDDNNETLDDQSVYKKKTVYVDALDSKSNNTSYNNDVNLDEAKEDFAQRQSFGAMGFNIRFIYVLGN